MIVKPLKKALSAPRNDGTLHFSQHLQHDRHTALYKALGYPTTDLPWGRIFPLVQGTGIHETIHATMASLYPKYLPEKAITANDERLEYEWGGTADAYVNIDGDLWLLDYKTISGAGVEFLDNKPKEDHVWQVSAYYHFGPKAKGIRSGVLYLPSSPNYRKHWAEPVLYEFEPIEYETLLDRMLEVEEACNDYEIRGVLPPPPDGEYKWKKKGKKFELVYRPHYTTMFCPWAPLADDPCNCSEDKMRVIAHYKDGEMEYDAKDAHIIKMMGGPDGFDS